MLRQIVGIQKLCGAQVQEDGVRVTGLLGDGRQPLASAGTHSTA